LGLLYRKGLRGIPDYHRAIYWLQMAADAGHPKAFGAIGELYLNGFGVDKSLEKAIHYIEQSASQGDAASQYNLSILLTKHNDDHSIHKSAQYWLREAATQGLAQAQIDLGALLLREDAQGDLAEGYMWALLGAHNGDDRGDGLRSYCEQNLSEQVLDEGYSRFVAFQKPQLNG
jgi:hypothetical protein